jgi:bacterioferritin
MPWIVELRESQTIAIDEMLHARCSTRRSRTGRGATTDPAAADKGQKVEAFSSSTRIWRTTPGVYKRFVRVARKAADSTTARSSRRHRGQQIHFNYFDNIRSHIENSGRLSRPDRRHPSETGYAERFQVSQGGGGNPAEDVFRPLLERRKPRWFGKKLLLAQPFCSWLLPLFRRGVGRRRGARGF